MKNNNLELYQKLMTKNAHISIIGLGYVGLPLLLALGKEGFSVTGIDIDNEKVEVNISENVNVEVVRSSGIQGIVNSVEPKK